MQWVFHSSFFFFKDFWWVNTCFTPGLHTPSKRETVETQVPEAPQGGRAPAFARPLPTRPPGPRYLDRAPPEAVDSVGIRARLQELPHGLHLPPRRGAGQTRIAATASELDLLFFPHFADARQNRDDPPLAPSFTTLLAPAPRRPGALSAPRESPAGSSPLSPPFGDLAARAKAKRPVVKSAFSGRSRMSGRAQLAPRKGAWCEGSGWKGRSERPDPRRTAVSRWEWRGLVQLGGASALPTPFGSARSPHASSAMQLAGREAGPAELQGTR